MTAQDSHPQNLLFSPRLTLAVEYARRFHTEMRKGTRIPYMAHLLGVAVLVMEEAGGSIAITEEMVLAAILHDVVEDHGGLTRLHELEAEFGPDVARMVEGLSDTLAEDPGHKESWEERKRNYLERLRQEPEQVLVISAADKFYNAKAMLDDYRVVGDALWLRFHRGCSQQLWYFGELRAIFQGRIQTRATVAFSAVLDELTAITAADCK